MGKLQDRLAKRTADIERPGADSVSDMAGKGRSMSMPGQLGAFRLEAQKYQDLIATLTRERDDALSPVHAATSAKQRIALDLVYDSPYQPRLEYDPEEIDKLSRTMSAAQQADPIKVRKVGERYELISGHRRARAARTLGWTEIEAFVEIRSDEEAEVQAMLLVVGNVGLQDYELAKMYDRAIKRGICKNQTLVGNFFGCTQSAVSACIRMLSLPPKIIQMLERKPSLFSQTTSDAIHGLIKTYPTEIATIVEGVERIANGMAQSSLKAWVIQKITKDDRSAATDEKTRTITKLGREVFKTVRESRVVTVQLKVPNMDTLTFEARLNAWLQSEADKVSDEDLAPVKKLTMKAIQ